MSDGLPHGWTKALLGDVTIVLDSKRVPINEAERTARLAVSAERFPYFGATGQVGEIDGYLFDGEAVLLGEDGAPFLDAKRSKAYLVDGKYWVNNHAHILRTRQGLSNRYLCYQLNVVDYRRHVSGTTRLKLTQAAMREIELVVAPIDEQQRIVSKIDELFSRIEEGERALERVQTLVERYRQSVLKAAVTGELTREWREQRHGQLESGEALLQRMLSARRQTWEQDELTRMSADGARPRNERWKLKYREPPTVATEGLPELPAGWVWTTLGSLIVWGPQNGLYLHKDRYGRGVPIVRIDDYQPGWTRPVQQMQRVDASASDREKYQLADLDIVINRVNSLSHLGKCMLATPEHAGVLFESNMMRLRVTPQVSVPYLERYLRGDFGRKRLVANCKHAVNQASINQDDVAATPVPLPPRAEQDKIVDLADRELSKVGAEALDPRELARRSQSVRQAVLRSAFSGTLVPSSV